MTLIATPTDVLTDDMLARFDERAPVYDRENRFFTADFEELRASGYLNIAVPREFGGYGLTLAEAVALQRRLAYHAPATALAVNMHLYWTGTAAELYRAGDTSSAWILEEAARGKVFAAGHGESGVDLPLIFSTTQAARVDGGWEFTGRKTFGSLSPVWDYFGLHGMDSSDPENPAVVHAFLARNDPGYRIEETWDTLGMRATQSQDTVLERAFVPDERVSLVTPAGFKGVTLFHLGIYAWGVFGFAGIYAGVARRAYDLTVENAQKRTSVTLSRPMAYHPEVQHGIAQMVLELESIEPHLEHVAREWSEGVDHGAGWIVKIVSAKYHAVEGAWRVIDRAFDLAGGFGIFRRGPFEQLFRDARLGRIHPANSMLTHELVGKLTLGINPDEQPRWG